MEPPSRRSPAEQQPQFGLDQQQPRQRQMGRRSGRFRKQPPDAYRLEKVVGLTGFVIIHVFIASFFPAQGERNQIVIAKFTRPVNAMPMSTSEAPRFAFPT